jgi:hypothetical protein
MEELLYPSPKLRLLKNRKLINLKHLVYETTGFTEAQIVQALKE